MNEDIYIYTCKEVCVCIYIYIYVYVERGRETLGERR